MPSSVLVGTFKRTSRKVISLKNEAATPSKKAADVAAFPHKPTSSTKADVRRGARPAQRCAPMLSGSYFVWPLSFLSVKDAA